MADENDDLLDPSEIEELLKASGQTPPPGEDPPPTSEPPTGDQPQGNPPVDAGAAGNDDLLDPSDIESLLQQRDGGPAADAGSTAGNPPAAAGPSETEQLLNQAEADLAAAIAPEFDRQSEADLEGATKFEFEPFADSTRNSGSGIDLDSLHDVELDLKIELGRAELLIDEVLQLQEGSVVPLDKLAGDPVDVLVNGQLIARGEVLVLNDNFCVRIAEILTPES